MIPTFELLHDGLGHFTIKFRENCWHNSVYDMAALTELMKADLEPFVKRLATPNLIDEMKSTIAQKLLRLVNEGKITVYGGRWTVETAG